MQYWYNPIDSAALNNYEKQKTLKMKHKIIKKTCFISIWGGNQKLPTFSSIQV